MTLDEADLLALKERFATGGQDAREIVAVVDELLALRKLSRSETRRDVMMMAACVASELTHGFDIRDEYTRDSVASQAVSMAFAIEKATPR